jgi:hypothetical protein
MPSFHPVDPSNSVILSKEGEQTVRALDGKTCPLPEKAVPFERIPMLLQIRCCPLRKTPTILKARGPWRGSAGIGPEVGGGVLRRGVSCCS